MKKILIIVYTLAISIGVYAQVITPQPALPAFYNKLTFNSDMRFRLENDFNGITASGSEQDDRIRMRIRARFGFNYNFNEHFDFGMRIRTGNNLDQQSPHITLGSPGEFGTIPIGLDKAYIKYNSKNFFLWAGKNSFPFYTNNELFWDDDVNPEGVTVGYTSKSESGLEIKPTIGYYIVGSQGDFFGKDRSLTVGQLYIKKNVSTSAINVAAGFFAFNNLSNTPDGSGTYTLDYDIMTVAAKYTQKLKVPISIGVDLMMNFTDYSADSNITVNAMEDETLGYVINLEAGQLANKGNFLIGYYYSHIEKYSVVDYFAQDDWTRWGFDSAPGTRSSNFAGHEIRLGYALSPKNNLVFRAYFLEGIQQNYPDATLEKNSRIRLDWNIAF